MDLRRASIVGIGILLLTGGVAAYTVFSCSEYVMEADQLDSADQNATTVEFQDLSGSQQSTFRKAIRDGNHPLSEDQFQEWSKFSYYEGKRIRYQGDYYAVVPYRKNCGSADTVQTGAGVAAVSGLVLLVLQFRTVRR